MLEQEAGVASWRAGLSSNPEDAGPGDALTGAPLWELSLAAAHFHPHIAQAAASITTLPPDSELCSLLNVLFPLPRLPRPTARIHCPTPLFSLLLGSSQLQRTSKKNSLGE